MAGGKTQLTDQEELMLQDFSRNVTTKTSIVFYLCAAIVSAVPVWLFVRIQKMEPKTNAILFGLVCMLVTYLLSFAYRNVKYLLKHKIAQKRGNAVTKEVMRRFGDDKKVARSEKEQRILWKKNEVAEYEALTFSIFYNNSMFLLFVIATSFYLLRSFSSSVNFSCSMLISSGLVALFSTSTKY